MISSIVPVRQVFKSYQSQVKFAELNRRVSIKSQQGQVDRVSISPEARLLLGSPPASRKGPERGNRMTL